MEKFFKTPTNTSIEKRKRFINPLFLGKYGIPDVVVKEYMLCVLNNLPRNH